MSPTTRHALLRVIAVRDGRLLYADTIPMRPLGYGRYVNEVDVSLGPFDQPVRVNLTLLPRKNTP